jgi:hypothetical protein
MQWVVIGPADYDRGPIVFGPFSTRAAAEAFADEQRAEAKKALAQELDVPDDEIDDDDDELAAWDVSLLVSPE